MNTGNPVGQSALQQITVYIQDAPLASIKSFTLHVRGLECINNNELTKPNLDAVERILFPSVRKVDLYGLFKRGQVDGTFSRLTNGQLCVYTKAAVEAFYPQGIETDSSCLSANFVVPIRGNRTVSNLPQGDYEAVIFDDVSGQRLPDTLKFTMSSGDKRITQ